MIVLHFKEDGVATIVGNFKDYNRMMRDHIDDNEGLEESEDEEEPEDDSEGEREKILDKKFNEVVDNHSSINNRNLTVS